MQKLFISSPPCQRPAASQPWIQIFPHFFPRLDVDRGILVEKRIRLENVKHATSFNDLQTFAKT